MLYVTLIILAVTILGCLFHRDFKSPKFIFSAIWFIIIFLYSLRLYGIYDVGTNTRVVIFLGCISFLSGTTIMEHIVIHPSPTLYSNVKTFRLSYIFVFLILSSLYFYVPNLMSFFKGTSVNALKMMLVTGERDLGGFWMQYVIRPFTYIIIGTSTYYFIKDKSKKVIISCGLILTCFEFFGTGSKTIVLYFAMCLLFTLLNNRHEIMITGKKRVILISTALILFLLFFMGISRVYFYACGCIPLLDKVINSDFYMPYGYTYGFVSFNSCVRFLIKFLLLFGINVKSNLLECADSYIGRFEYTTQVSPEGGFNAFHTFMGDFYVDFGIVGVIILSLLFGMACMYVYKIYSETDSLWGHVFYCLSLYYLFFSAVRFQMSNTFLGIMVIYTVLILKFIFYANIYAGRIEL